MAQVSNKTILILVAAVAVAAAATAVLLRGDGESAQLSALRADPMAGYVPAGGRLVDEDAQGEGESTLGKPVLAGYDRLFELRAGAAAEALGAALAAAEEAGWTRTGEPQPSLGGVVGFAERQLETGRARLAVTLFEDGTALRDGVSPPALKLALEHLSAP